MFPAYAGKTLQNRVEALCAFCRWHVKRGYLADDPLKGLAPFDITSRIKRRAMARDEIQRFPEAAEQSSYGASTWALRGAASTESVGAVGLEPTAYGLKIRCSTELSYAPVRTCV